MSKLIKKITTFLVTIAVALQPVLVHAVDFSYKVPLKNLTVADSSSAPSNGATAVLASNTINFGSQPINSTSSVSAVLSNNGTATLSLSSTPIVSGEGFHIVSSTCGTEITASNFCSVSVLFAPTTAGSYSGTLTFNTSVGTRIVSLVGIVDYPIATYSQNSLEFGSVATTETNNLTVRLTNTGTATLNITQAPSLSGSAYYTLSSDCGSSLSPASFCDTSVSYSPTVFGNHNSTLSFTTNLGVKTIPIAGTGNAPFATLSSINLDFGAQEKNTSTNLSVRLSNTGTQPLTLNSAPIFSGNAQFTNFTSQCSGSLAPGQYCDSSLNFEPLVAGPVSGTLSFNTNAGTKVVTLAGLGLASAVTMSTYLLDFGNAVPLSSPTASVRLLNSGSSPLTIGSISSNSSLYTYTTACSGVIAVNAFCDTTVTFTPQTAGVFNGLLSIVTDAGTQNINLTGQGYLAILQTSHTAISFGSQPIGTPVVETVTIQNTGTAPFNFVSPPVISVNAQYSSSTNCGASLAANSTCSVSITFNPSVNGSSSTSLNITTSAGTQTIPISGITTSAVASYSTTTLNFGIQDKNTSQTLTVRLTNTGNVSLPISVPSFTGDSQFNSFTTQCSGALSANDYCDTSITFTPLNSGVVSGTISFNTSAGVQNVAVQGTGAQPVLSLSTSNINFGNIAPQASSSQSTVRLTNTGTGTLILNSITVSSSEYTIGFNCGSSLTANQFCDVGVVFNPVSVGSKPASLQISSNVGNSSVALSGQGYAPILSVSPSSVSFGNVSLSTFDTSVISITNTGTAPLSFNSPPTLSGNAAFTLSTTCGVSLNAGSSCTATITLTPTVNGLVSAVLTLDTTGGTQNINASGTGASASGSLSATNVAFGNVTVNTTATSGTVRFTNTGNLNLTISPAVYLTGSSTFSATTTNCGATLAPNDYCDTIVRFNPTAIGLQTGTFTFNTNVGAYTLTVSGTGSGGILSVSPTSVNLTSIVNATASQAITVTNTGNTALGFTSSFTISGDARFSINSNTCTNSPTLAANASCVVSILFAPGSAPSGVGTFNGTLSATTDSISAPTAISIAMTGSGINPIASLSNSSFAYGTRVFGTTTTLSTVLSNTGQGALTVGTPTLSGNNQFTNTVSNCPSSLAQGSSCTISVDYVPNATSAVTATLSIPTSTSTPTVSLSGTGVAALATLSSPLNYNNSLVGGIFTSTATLTNTGSSTLTISSAVASGTYAVASPTGNCGASLAPGANCQYIVSYAPTNTVSSSVTLTVISNAGVMTSSWTGTANSVSAATTSYGGLANAVITLTPAGTATFVAPSYVRIMSGATIVATSSSINLNGTTRVLSATFATLPAGGTYTLEVYNASNVRIATSSITYQNAITLDLLDGSNAIVTNLAYGTVTSGTTKVLQFRNNASSRSNLVISNIVPVSANLNFVGMVGSGGATCTVVNVASANMNIPVGATCALTIQFTGTPSGGPYISNYGLTITSNVEKTAFSSGNLTQIPYSATVSVTYATWSSTDKSSQIELPTALTAQTTLYISWSPVRATKFVSSGKWYWEIKVNPINSFSGYVISGISTSNFPTNVEGPLGATAYGGALGYYLGQNQTYFTYYLTYDDVTFHQGGADSGAGPTTYMYALDMDNKVIYLGKNGVWLGGGVPTSGAARTGAWAWNLTGSVAPTATIYTGSITANFGASAFTYTPPAGYNAGLY